MYSWLPALPKPDSVKFQEHFLQFCYIFFMSKTACKNFLSLANSPVCCGVADASTGNLDIIPVGQESPQFMGETRLEPAPISVLQYSSIHAHCRARDGLLTGFCFVVELNGHCFIAFGKVNYKFPEKHRMSSFCHEAKAHGWERC